MKNILSLIGVFFVLFTINSATAQVVGYFEGPLGTMPLISPDEPSTSSYNYNSSSSSNNSDIIDLGSSILKKRNSVSSISFLEYNSWFNIAFNKIGFANQKNVIIIEILGNTGASLSYNKQISFVGDYLIIDGKSKQIVGMALYDVYSK